MNTRSLPGVLLLVLSLAGLFLPSVCHADYDQAAEIQRLIDRASKDIAKDKEASAALSSDMKKVYKSFENIAEVQKSVDDVLIKVRHTNINNTTKMAFQAGLNFTKVIPTSQISEAATDFAFERVADYLKEKYPNAMNGRITQNVGRAKESSVTGVQKFNWTISLDEQALAGYIRTETPELAAKEGSIGDNLIILKHSQLIRQAGDQAISQLDTLLKALLEQHKLLAGLKGSVDNDIKRLEEEIRSWNRQLELIGILKSANEWSKSPDMVTFPTDSNYDFGTAASKMREAWQKLAGGSYSCRSYDNAVWNAYQGAQRKMSDLLQPIYEAARAACASGNGAACSAAQARASAAAASVRRAFESQVVGTTKQLHADAKAMADGPIHSFGLSLYKWNKNEVDMVIWGEEHTMKMEGQHGDWLGMAIWQYALSNFRANNVSPRFYPMSVKRLAQSEKVLQEWKVDAKNQKDYFQQRMDAAKRSTSTVAGYASTATQLAGELQPNIEIWDCFRSAGSYGYDPSRGSFENVRYQYDRLAHFEAAFNVISRNGEDAGRQLIEAASKNVALTNKVVDALRGAASVMDRADKLVASAKKQRIAQEGDLDVNGGQVYAILGHYGVNDSGIKALDQRIKDALADPLVLEKEALSQVPLMPGYPVKNMVLTNNGIEELKATVKRILASIDNARDSYERAYKNTERAEASLDTALQAMRDKLTPIFPAEAPYFFKDEVLREYSESEDHLALILRNRIGAANQLPDSGLGSGKLIERYAALAKRYHALVDPMIPVARANRYAPAMEEILKKLEADSGRLSSLNNAAFSKESNRYSNDAYKLITKANNEGKVEPKSRVNVAYGAIMSKLSSISFNYYQGQRLSRAQAILREQIGYINAFLSNPDGNGGWLIARQHLDNIESVKKQIDASVRNHPSIQALVDQLDALKAKLRAVANKVDSGTLERDRQAITAMYADFSNAYQSKNYSAVSRLFSRNWHAADGSDIYDLEETLSNSFRMFNSVKMSIEGLSIQRVEGSYKVRYQATLTGSISRLRPHKETSNVEDTVSITPDGPRIMSSTGILH